MGLIGDLAEISNDLLYESKDSLEIGKGSISSFEVVRVLIEVTERLPLLRGQKLFFSGGEGGKYTPLSFTTLILYSGGSSLFAVLMLIEDAREATVETRSKEGRDEAF